MVRSMKDWEWIRSARADLTDYVVHFTKHCFRPPVWDRARDVLAKILTCGYIRPTFAFKPTRFNRTPRPTIKGPTPAVCLTEQPVSAILKTSTTPYSGYGIAYHKVPLYEAGGRPVLYGSQKELGRPLRQEEQGWEREKEVCTGGLPPELQYLWVRYKPLMAGSADYPVDFTWEREWRVKVDGDGLPVLLRTDWYRPPKGIIIVERDEDIAFFREELAKLAVSGKEWSKHLTRIASLSTAKNKLKEGDDRYAKLDTWPDEAL
jgi:hypothetical protein